MSVITSDPRSIFGIDSVMLYDRCSGDHHGLLKVLKNSSLSLSGEQVQLNGGSNRFSWSSEDGLISSELSLAFAEYPAFLDAVFLGKAATIGAAEASGFVGNLEEVQGTSMLDVANGIDAVEATAADEVDIKFGKYLIEAVSADTVDVYISSDIDFGTGTAGAFLTGTKIAAAVDVSVADGILADYGITISQIGTPAFTIGDTLRFETRPINNGYEETVIGGLTNTYPEFGVVAYSQKDSSGRMFELDCFRCKAVGMPFNMSPQEFSEAEITISCLYDSVRDGVFKKRRIL